LVPSNDGRDLKLRGRVAMVLAPFSRSFWRYFEITKLYLYFRFSWTYLQNSDWNKEICRTFLYF